MQCPSCGLSVDQPMLDRCPRCGRTLATAPEPALYTEVAPQDAASAAPSAGSPSAAPPQNPYGPFTPYGAYPAYPPPSGYVQPYGYGPQPTVPGYAPPGYPQPTPPAAPSPQAPRKKPRTRLIVAIVAVMVVVLAGCGWGIVATVQALHLPTVSAIPHVTPNEVYSNDFSSNAAGWADDSHCFLKDDGFHVTSDYICYAPIGNYSDIDVKAQVKQLSGPTNTPISIEFRLLNSGTNHTSYVFAVTSDGRWEFAKCGGGACARPVNFRGSSAINKGIGATNTLEVYAKGSHMDFFINGKVVGSLDDSTYSTGMVGLFCGDGMECVFTNLFIGELD